MSKYNNGVIFTNQNCIACNKCVGTCNILGANVCTRKNDKAYIEVDSDKCNHCGKCISSCTHNARDYRDDTNNFLTDLSGGESISLIVSPLFYIYYRENAAEILGYLKDQGVNKIYDEAFGTELSMYMQANYLKKHENLPADSKAFISNNCPSLINIVEMFHPELIEKIIPVQSPAVSTAIYARNELKNTDKFAYLGCCISKKDDFESSGSHNLISYNLTFKHLMKSIGTSLHSDQKAYADLKGFGFGDLLCIPGSRSELMSIYFGNSKTYKTYTDISPKTVGILKLSTKEGNRFQPFYAEVSSCPRGCLEGPGKEPYKADPALLYSTLAEIKEKVSNEGYDNIIQSINSVFSKLNPEDYYHSFEDKYRQPFHIPQSAYDEIYAAMLKDTPEKQSINCGYCGYSSCHEMAKAIAYGYNRRENCIHYMNDLAKQKYYFNSLTGLMNIEPFFKQVYSRFTNNPKKNYFLAHGNINKLNLINDIYGFDTGNLILRNVAGIIKKRLSPEGFAAYLGGGNYVFVDENTPENLSNFCKSDPFDFSQYNIDFLVTMRFGIYLIEDKSVTLRSMVDWAAMAGETEASPLKNTYRVFSDELHERLFLDADITSKMGPALKNNEFVLYFQPQYSSQTGLICGAEALCRWLKPDGTIIPPGIFIPIAEKNGFIRLLDSAIWRQAYTIIREWIDSGIDPVPISINISRVSLETDKIVSTIKGLHEEFKIPVDLIHYEITESSYFANDKEFIERIKKIREIGYKIAMDDFGSGYSSLNSLKDMPIDILKLDMGFIKDDTNMDRGGTIINAVSRMAHDLELVSVAEGVEKSSQSDFLTSIGIDVIQGYYFAKPIPQNEFTSLLLNNSDRSLITKKSIYGKLDIGRFFDPTSYQSLMFEAFSGAACIFEYNDLNDTVTLLRINKRGMDTIGCTGLDFNCAAGIISSLCTTIDATDFIGAIRTAIKTGFEEDCIVTISENNHSIRWLKCHILELISIKEIHTLYAILEDVTNEQLFYKTLEFTKETVIRTNASDYAGICLLHGTINHEDLKSSKIKLLKFTPEIINSFGYSENELLEFTADKILGCIYTEDYQHLSDEIVKSFNGSEFVPCVIECRFVFSDKSVHPMKLYLAMEALNDNSYIIGVSFTEIK